MIELNHVTMRYRAAGQAPPALDDVSLHIAPGECVLVCGASGCGKTSLTHVVNGLVPHYYDAELSGDVFIGGQPVAETTLAALAHRVGSVFQNPRSQFFCVDTDSELSFGPENAGMPEGEIRMRVAQVAAEMGIAPLRGRSIFALSGGEKQKVACASVSTLRPQVYVLDEPTSNLDLGAIDDLSRILRGWKEAGATIVVAEHRLGWLADVCDRVVVLDAGCVVDDFTAEEFFSKGDGELAALGLRSAKPGGGLLGLPAGFHRLALEDDGSAAADCGDADAGDASARTVDFSSFSYSYGAVRALELPAFSAPEHAIVAVIGRNGAGKSTFSRCLCGLQKRFGGSVRIGADEYSGRKLRKLGYLVMQDVNHQLFAESVMEELALGLKESAGAEERARAVLARFGLADVADRHPFSLSGGQKQRVAIASALLSDRPVLVLDEPTSGLDLANMRAAADLIRDAANDKTVFVITHDAELVSACCTHVLHITK